MATSSEYGGTGPTTDSKAVTEHLYKVLVIGEFGVGMHTHYSIVLCVANVAQFVKFRI